MSKPLIILTLVLSLIVANASLSADAQPPSKEGHSTSEEPAAVESSPPRLLERKPPARGFPIRHTLSVTDFGARPDDGKDDLAGIRAAMSKAAGLKEPTAVLLPKGTYDLFLPKDPYDSRYSRTRAV
jgi:hypothetical protein